MGALLSAAGLRRVLKPTGRGRGVSRLAALALGVLVLAVGLTYTNEANATVFNIIPSDGTDVPVTEFRDDRELWAYTTADISGGLVCVLPKPFLVQFPGVADCQSSRAWGLTFIPGGTAGIWPISRLVGPGLPDFSELPPSIYGEWVLAVDETTTYSVPFTVSPCPRLSCPTRLVSDAKDLFKAHKTQAKQALEALCHALTALNIAEATLDAKTYTDMLVVEYAGVGLAASRFTVLREFGGSLAINAFRRVLTPPGIAKWSVSATGKLMCYPGLQNLLQLIIADPPDPNYETVVVPQYSNLPLSNDAAADKLIRVLDHLVGDTEAMLIAFERYQGADESGAERYVHVQARSIAEVGFDALADMRQSVTLLRAEADRAAADADLRNPVLTQAQWEIFQDVFDRIRIDGFTAAELAQFQSEGFTNDEIAILRERLSADLNNFAIGASLPELLRGFADTIAAQLIPTEAFVRHAAAIGGRTNEPPTASFRATPEAGAAPLDVAFEDASSSPDLDPIVAVTWDFGDGVSDTGSPVVHPYAAPGTYTVRLTACDYLACDTETRAITVPIEAPNRPPAAVDDVLVTLTNTVASVDVFANDSDPDGDTLTLTAWTNGANGFVSCTPGGSCTYAPAPGFTGTDSFTYTVTDGDGSVAVGSVDVTVEAPANRPPTAAFAVAPDVPLVGVATVFTDTSTDPDADIDSYSWDFGDGGSSTQRHPQHVYTAAGTYVVVLTVEDAKGNVDTETRTVEVTEAPVAAFTFAPERPLAGDTVQFTDGSTDGDGTIETRAWDFGDGGTSDARDPTHVYADPGSYTARLTVTDDDGATASATQQVTVRGPPEPQFTTGPGVELAGAANGGSVVFATSESTSGPASRVIDGGTLPWQSANGQTTNQTLRIRLGAARVVDRIVLQGNSLTSSVKDFDVRTSDGGLTASDFEPAVTATLARGNTPQSFSFAPRRARFVEIVVLTNWGSSLITQLTEVDVWGRDRQGGIVSLLEGERPRVVGFSSMAPSSPPENALDESTTSWRTASGQRTNQWLRVELGGGREYTIDRVALTAALSTGPRSFEIRVSTTTADEAEFATVLAATAANTTTRQQFSFPSVAARYVELRLLDNHGSSCCIDVQRFEVLTTEGRNAARLAGVGAGATATSGASPFGAIDSSAVTNWRTTAGNAVDQALTVLLIEGGPHVVDRVTLRGSGNVDSPRDVEVQLAQSAAGPFETVLAVTLPRDTVDHEFLFDPAPARYARLLVKNVHGGTAVQVNEFQVFATDRGGESVAFDDLTQVAPGASSSWEFGDGGTSSERHPTHTYAAPGTYPVTLRVTDAEGASAEVTRPYTVLPRPIADFTIAGSRREGTNIVFADASESSGVSVAWRWTFEGSSPAGTSATAAHAFTDNGTWDVTLEVTDSSLLTASVTKQVEVENAPPTVDAGPVTRVVVDEPAQLSTFVSDPGLDDRATLTCTWDYGDGTTVEAGCAPRAHTWTTAGTYTVRLTAADKDGGVTSDTTTVTVEKLNTFVSVHAVPGTASGGGVSVVARVWSQSGRWWLPTLTGTWKPLAGAELALSLGGDARTVTTGADGSAAARLALPAAGGTVRAVFAETPKLLPSADEDAVPGSGLPPGDIVFLVDESGSMASHQAAVRANVTLIANRLGESVDYQLGLVGFGDAEFSGMPHIQRPLTDDLSEFVGALAELDLSGGFEPGFAAVEHAMGDALGFRPNAGVCAVFVGDELSNQGSVTKDQALAAVRARNGVVLTIQNPDAGYSALAVESGGQEFSINAFRTDPIPVLNAIVDKCVATIQARPDLAVSIDDGRDTIGRGAETTYDVTIRNDGASDVADAQATVTLPAGLEIVAADGGTLDGSTVSWPAFALDAGDTAQRTLRARVSPSLPAAVNTLEVRAHVTDGGAAGPDLVPANNDASDTNTVEAQATRTAPDLDVATDEDVAVVIALGDGVIGHTGPAHGTFDGTTYVPNPNYHGPDSFEYMVDDGSGGTDTGTVSITVRPVNDLPDVGDFGIVTDEDVPVAIGLVATDVDGDLLAITTTQPAHGSYENGVYTPVADYFGPDSFEYTSDDGNGGSDTATVSITVRPVNDAPNVADREVATDEDTPLPIGLTGSDPENDTLTITTTQPAHGSYENGVYTPDANYFGPDSFDYTADDGNGGSDTATVSISVRPVNDPPNVADREVATDEDTPLPIGLTGSDPENDTLTITTTQPAHGTYENGVYTPAANYFGPDSFDYAADDGNGGSDTATVSITVRPVNDPPNVADREVATDEDTAMPIELTGSDPENDTLTITTTQPAHGSYENGVYIPDADYFGPDSFDYTADDGNGGTDTATVSITVRPVNDPPAVILEGPPETDEGAAPVTFVATASDPDGDSLGYTWTAGSGELITAGATVAYTNDDGPRLDPIGVTVTDGSATASASVEILVRNVDPTADAGPDQSAMWGLPLLFAGLATDPSAADTAAGLVGQWSFDDGTLPLAGLTAAHAFAQPGSYTATFSVVDKDGGSDVDTAAVTIAKRPTALSYTGATSGLFGLRTLSARLADTADTADTPTADLAGRTLLFRLGARSFTAVTNADGEATATAVLPLTSGTVEVSFEGDGRYLASAASAELTITSGPGKITGGGLRSLDHPGRGGFTINDAATGELQWQNGGLNYHAPVVTALGVAPDGRSAWFAGAARDGRPYVAYVEDNDEPGRADVFKLWVAGRLQTPGSGLLEAGGNLQIHTEPS